MIFFDKIQKSSFPYQPSLPSMNFCKTDCCKNDYNTSNVLEIKNNSTIINKLKSGIIYAFKDVWADIAGWFFIGIILAGFIMALIPDEFISQFLSGGISSMLLMLGIGIPIYICATASTPVAAALILKGVSPGTALVFLLAGPATNITSLTVLTGILGKKTCAIYLGTIALFSVVSGLILDQIYNYMNISPQAIIGTASKHIPFWMQLIGVIILIFISLNPFTDKFKKIVQKYKHNSISKNILKHKESG
ncbi:MAG: hypothetical protein B6I26_03430 [Desulfobacteraceae bacterium 4572_130]|nr:MAG: hypothetical protein B6I26_03430 [Desulfobacteraceae bacterium 4572_130]